MVDFGLHLKKLRKDHGYTQKQLAKKLHVSEGTIIRWETSFRYPTFESLMQLAVIYNVTLDYIAGLDKKQSIVIDGLTEEQISLLRMLVLEIQSANDASAGLSQRQHDIIDAIILEFKGV